MSNTITLVFGLLVAIVALATVSTRFHIPYAILLVFGGLLMGFIPGLPTIQLDPELILFLFLPPLIYSSAWLTSWHEFRANLRPILVLSIGLVLATTVIVAVVAHFAAGLPWPVAFVLGAVVSPTDRTSYRSGAMAGQISGRRAEKSSSAARSVSGDTFVVMSHSTLGMRPGCDRGRRPGIHVGG